MTGSEAPARQKTYVVDTSVLVSAPDALQHLTTSNTVVLPFPVLQELDRRRTSANGAGYTARALIRFLDDVQTQATAEDVRSGIRMNGGRLKFHDGAVDVSAAWPGFNSSYADDAIILLAGTYQREHPDEQVILVTRDAAMRCKARARAVTAEDYYSDRPVPSLEKCYSGRLRIDVPDDRASLLSTLHHEQRLSLDAVSDLVDTATLRANQCCELRLPAGRSAWAIYKNHDQPGHLRRVNTKPTERFGPSSAEQFCAREMILDEQISVVSLLGIAGTGKTLIALLSAYELLRSGRVSRIEVYRLNAEAGRELGFLPGDLGDKMAPWAKPIIDNLDFIMRRMHGSARWSNQLADQHGADRRDATHPTVEGLLQSKALEIAPINYLRGRSIHDTAIIVDDGQNLTQEDMKLVLTRAGEGSRVILTGDPDQIDREEINALSNGLVQVVERFKGQPCYGHLTLHEVMRSRVAEMAARLL